MHARPDIAILGDKHQPRCDRLKHMWHTDETHLHRLPNSPKCLFYVWCQVDLMGGYSAECGGQALVDVQCLWLMLGGMRVVDSQRSSVSPPPRCLLGWGRGTTGVRNSANYWGRCSQGCQRGCHTGLAPWCVPRCVVGGVVWMNGGLKNNRWQMSASEWCAKTIDGKWVHQSESSQH
jgi:hypothetical protein